MKTNKLYLIAALLGTTLVGCQKVAEVQTPEEPQDAVKTWTLTVKAVKSPQTRALVLEDGSLNAKWNADEIVAVYNGGSLLGTLSVTAVDDATGIATLSGEISLDGVETLSLLYPGRTDNAWTYLGQGGDAPALTGGLNQFDYATASIAVADLDTTNPPAAVLSSDAVEFTNEQSIYCFGFKDAGSADLDAITAKSFLLSSSLNQLVRSRNLNGGTWASVPGIITLNPTVSGTEYYMAVRNENTSQKDTYTFNVVGSDDVLYSGTKTIPASVLGNGKYLAARNIKVTKKSFAPETTGSVDTAL